MWIAPDKRGEAVVAGYTVVDPSTVLATHLNQLIMNSAADLFGMDEAQKLLDALKESAPQLVSGLTPNPLPLANIAALCRALLAEGVPLKDFRRIAEAMADAARDESRSGPAHRAGPPPHRRADRADAGAGADAAAGGHARRGARKPAHPGGPHRPEREPPDRARARRPDRPGGERSGRRR